MMEFDVPKRNFAKETARAASAGRLVKRLSQTIPLSGNYEPTEPRG